jgi:hypothetical protein
VNCYKFAENLRRQGFSFELDPGGRLRVKKPADLAEVPPALADAIVENGPDLVRLLRVEAKFGKVLLNDEAADLKTTAAELGVPLQWRRYELNRPLFTQPPEELDPRDVDPDYGSAGPVEQQAWEL